MPLAQLSLQLLISALIVLGVLWFMWRLPRKGEAWFGWAPLLALGSVWAGLLAVVMGGLLWVLPYPDRWIVPAFLIVDPAAIGAGVMVLWIYRGRQTESDTIIAQTTQARVGITLGLLAVVIGYIFVWTHKDLFTPVGQ